MKLCIFWHLIYRFQVGDIINFKIDIEVLKCPKDRADHFQTIQIYPIGINESLIIDLEMLCECNCEKPGDKVRFGKIEYFRYSLISWVFKLNAEWLINLEIFKLGLTFDWKKLFFVHLESMKCTTFYIVSILINFFSNYFVFILQLLCCWHKIKLLVLSRKLRSLFAPGYLQMRDMWMLSWSIWSSMWMYFRRNKSEYNYDGLHFTQ